MANLATACGVSRQYLYEIERATGSPGLPVVYNLARALQVSVSSLLAPGERAVEVEVAELGYLMSKDEPAEVVRRGLALLAGRGLSEAGRAEVNHHVGWAHARLMQSTEAVPFLTRALDHAEASGDEQQAIACMLWLGKSEFLLDMEFEGLQRVEDALRRCERLDPVPLELLVAILSILGAMHKEQQRWTRAVEVMTRAIDAANQFYDVRYLGMNYHNLAEAHERLGNIPRAIEYIRRAESLYRLNRSQRSLMWLYDELGRVWMRAGRMTQARAEFERAVAIGRTLPGGTGRDQRSDPHLDLAEWHLRSDDAEGARPHLAEAITLIEQAQDRPRRARAHTLAARLERAWGNVSQAIRELEAAILILEEVGPKRELVTCHREVGDLLSKAGHLKPAAHHWRQALALTEVESDGPGFEDLLTSEVH